MPKTQAEANLEAILGPQATEQTGYFPGPVGPPSHQGTIGLPSVPPSSQGFSLEEAMKRDEYNRMVEQQRWEELDPRGQIMDWAGMATDVADLPMGAGKALITGSPQTVEALTQGVKRLGAIAPESKLGQWAKRTLDPENLDDLLEGFRQLPRKAAEQFKKQTRSGGLPLGAAWEQPVAPGYRKAQRIWLNLKEGGEKVAPHEGAHAFWGKLDDPTKAAWEEIVERHGRHPRVPYTTPTQEIVNESLAETLQDISTGGGSEAPGLVQDLLIALGQ